MNNTGFSRPIERDSMAMADQSLTRMSDLSMESVSVHAVDKFESLMRCIAVP